MAKDCGCNEQPTTNCGCGEKLDLLCTFYGGKLLLPLNIPYGTDGNTVIKIINDYIKEVLVNIELEATVIESIGNGAILYKGVSSELKHQIKSMLEGSGVKITEQDKTVTISIDPQWINDNILITNVGTGAKIWKDRTGVTNNLRSLKSSDSVTFSEVDNEITASIDSEWQETNIPVIDGKNVGGETPIFKGLSSKKLEFRTLTSEDINIRLDGTDKIRFSLPSSGSSTTGYSYLDSNFIRAADWEERTNPVSILNTTIYPTAKLIPKGTLNDPFIDYTEFLLYAIGNTTDTNNGAPVSSTNPKHIRGNLQILNNTYTHQKIEVNTWTITIKNGATLTHTGLEEYSLDMRRLWTSEIIDSTTHKLKRTIYFCVAGEGILTRTLGLGLIYSKGDETKTDGKNGIFYRLDIAAEGKGIYIIEALNPYPDTNPMIPQTRADGITPLYYGSEIATGRVQLATTPLIVVDGSTDGYWGTIFSGSKVFIVSMTQAHIKFVNKGKLNYSVGQLFYKTSNKNFGYKRKMVEDNPGNTPAENLFLQSRRDLVNYPGEKGFFFMPQDDNVVFDIGDDCTFRVENLATEPSGFLHTGSYAVLKLYSKSLFNNLISWVDTGGGNTYNFIVAEGDSNYIHLEGFNYQSSCNTFIKGSGSNYVGINLVNSKVNNFLNLKEDVGTLVINTETTLSTLNNAPIIAPTPIYNNNANAIIGGLDIGMIYRTPAGILTQVI